MSKTLATIRTDFYTLIDESESNSHISASIATGFANEAIQRVAIETHHPRKFDTGTQVTDNDADYDAASDFVYIVGAYFGDESISGDKLPLKIVREAALKYIDPNWLDRSSESKGRPTHLLCVDRNSFMLYPRPNADESASGKKLWLYYSYTPTSVSADSDVPDLPDVYHDALKYYMAFLAYNGKLANPQQAAINFKLFNTEIEARRFGGEMEAEENLRFQWGFREE